MKLVDSFPVTVEHKSCKAIIYRHKHRQRERFEVRYYDVDGSLTGVGLVLGASLQPRPNRTGFRGCCAESKWKEKEEAFAQSAASVEKTPGRF